MNYSLNSDKIYSWPPALHMQQQQKYFRSIVVEVQYITWYIKYSWSVSIEMNTDTSWLRKVIIYIP